MKGHYSPAPIVIAERLKFWTAAQGTDEKVADFIVRLKTLSSTCSFGNFLDEALRDKLVSGLNAKMARTQTFLLTQKTLTFNKAKDRCLADEMAEQPNQVHLGTQLSSEAGVNRLQGRSNQQSAAQSGTQGC